jgi:hypothetical protein
MSSPCIDAACKSAKSDCNYGGKSHAQLGILSTYTPLYGMMLATATVRVLPNSSITSAPKLFYHRYLKNEYGPSAFAYNLPGMRC